MKAEGNNKMPESFSFLITSSLLRGTLTLILIVVLTIVALRLVNIAAVTIEKRFIAPIEDVDRQKRLQTLRKAAKSTIQVIILVIAVLIVVLRRRPGTGRGGD